MYYPIKTPWLLKRLFPKLYWEIPQNGEKAIYLTFDDGPNPGITDWVMDQLEAFNGKGTFFCQGNRVEEFPEFFKSIKERGHQVGNHSYDHPNGWQTRNEVYFFNVDRAQHLIGTKLFRPPYGKLKISQARHLTKEFQKVIMWDVVSGDFDVGLSNEKCLSNVTQNARSGSIVVFHDMPKAEEKLRYVLPKVLEHFASQGYHFKKID